ncbi:MAG: YraN family protein [Vicinamibacterales bacterium]
MASPSDHPRRHPALPGEPDRQALGQAGEDVACDALRQRGYEVVARRYRTRLGEIDIVARDGSTTVFVEVKARRGAAFGSGAEAVTATKRRRLVRMARDYLARARGPAAPCRFDVVTLDGGPDGWRVEVIAGAFDAGEG